MSNIDLSEVEVVTEPCRLAFPALFHPKPRMKGQTDTRLTYQAVVLIPPGTDLKPFVRAMKAAMQEKFGKVIQLKPDKNPLRQCEEKNEISGYASGWWYINTHSGFAPGLVDQRRQPVLDEEKFYAGCWCRFLLRAFAWNHQQGGKGVSFSLSAVQFVRDDDRLDGRRDASNVFDAIEIEGDDSVTDQGAEDDLDAIFG